MRSLPEAYLRPLLDRIDIHIDVPRVDDDKLLADRLGEPSSAIRARVEAARAVQRDRLAKPLPEDTLSAQRNGSLLNKSNADMGPAEVRATCKLDEAGKALMKAAMTQLLLSARAFHRRRDADAPAPSPILRVLSTGSRRQM